MWAALNAYYGWQLEHKDDEWSSLICQTDVVHAGQRQVVPFIVRMR